MQLDLNHWQTRITALASHAIVRAFALSLGFHLILFTTVELGHRLGLWRFSMASLRLLVPLPRNSQDQKAQRAEEPQKEVSMVFIDVDPARASQEAPENAKFYSARNSIAGNPEPAVEAEQPKISGKQENVPSTQDVPRPEPAPLQPAAEAPEPEPVPEPAPLQPEPEPEPPPRPAPAQETGPKPGELAMAKPAEQPKPQLEPRQIIRPPPAIQPRPRTLAQARQQLGLAQEKMKQEGGSKRYSIAEGLDVKATPFGSYDAAIIAAIQKRWYDLLEEHDYFRNHQGKVVVTFRLYSDGSVRHVSVMENEVTEILAIKCQRAVQDPAPFAPWPSDMRRLIGADYRDVRFTFHHN